MLSRILPAVLIPPALLFGAGVACVSKSQMERARAELARPWAERDSITETERAEFAQLAERLKPGVNPGHFTIPKDRSQDAWARANVWIGKYASMKTQVATEYVIETFNATDPGKFGYAISRAPDGDNHRFEIRCASDTTTTLRTRYGTSQYSIDSGYASRLGKDCRNNVAIAAHYIDTGVLLCAACIAQ